MPRQKQTQRQSVVVHVHTTAKKGGKGRGGRRVGRSAPPAVMVQQVIPPIPLSVQTQSQPNQDFASQFIKALAGMGEGINKRNGLPVPISLNNPNNAREVETVKQSMGHASFPQQQEQVSMSSSSTDGWVPHMPTEEEMAIERKNMEDQGWVPSKGGHGDVWEPPKKWPGEDVSSQQQDISAMEFRNPNYNPIPWASSASSASSSAESWLMSKKPDPFNPSAVSGPKSLPSLTPTLGPSLPAKSARDELGFGGQKLYMEDVLQARDRVQAVREELGLTDIPQFFQRYEMTNNGGGFGMKVPPKPYRAFGPKPSTSD